MASEHSSAHSSAHSCGPAGSADGQPDVDSTTGSGHAERDEHVGRVAGDDVGYAGETGAERRADAGE